MLRVSYIIVRAVHFMRTTPLEQWMEQAVKFDSMTRSAIECILADPLTSHPWWAWIEESDGARWLGLSRHEVQKTAKEVWVPPGLPEKYSLKRCLLCIRREDPRLFR